MVDLETERNTATKTKNASLEFTSDELKKKTVKDLKDLLKERNLKVNGNKVALIARLMSPPPPSSSENEVEAPEGFPETARWLTLKQNAEPVNFCSGRFKNPTQMQIENETPKYDYNIKLLREEFVEKSSVFSFDRHGAIKLSRDGKPVLEEAVQKKLRPKISWLQEHKLVPSSHPVEWLDAMLSRKQHNYKRRKNQRKAKVSISSNWKNYTIQVCVWSMHMLHILRCVSNSTT